jgi:two-component system, sensor histidine kinase RegB
MLALHGARAVPSDSSNDDRAKVSLPWLARLRWGAVASEILAVGTVQIGLDRDLPLALIGICIAATAVTNVWLEWALARTRPVSARVGGSLLCLDTALLTALLHLTGGPANPFSIMYLVHITLAAVMLGARWTWTVAGLAVACYGLLFLVAGAAPHDMGAHHAADGAFSAHLYGMWLAFSIAAALTAYFVVKLSAAIEQRDAQIAGMREQAARGQRLTALATLAAGAAHELGTPLATIAVAAKELERHLERLPSAAAAHCTDDVQLIRAELERCRHILQSMAAAAGETTGEAPAHFSIDELLGELLRDLPAHDAARIHVAVPQAEAASVAVPRRALLQAVSNLVRNALDAAPLGHGVELAVERTGFGLKLLVRDQGPGMPADVLARAGEPFFSTKPPGRGMGLGLFLSRAIAEQMGGRLALESVPGHGATAAIELPQAVIDDPTVG